MKYLLVAVMCLLTVSVTAQTMDTLPKGGEMKRGLAVLDNGGDMTVVFVNGIGELNDETKNVSTGIPKNIRWAGHERLKALAAKHKFNVIWTNSSLSNTTDEIDWAIEYACKRFGPNVHVVGLSWGGRRIKLWASRRPVLIPKTVTILAPGGIDVDDWTPTIELGIRTLRIHSQVDPVVPESCSSVSYIEAKKKDPNAPVNYIELYDDPVFNDEHNIQRYCSDWMIASSLCNPAYDTPKMTWLQWAKMNAWSDKFVSITEAYREKPAPAPVVIEPQKDTVVPMPDTVVTIPVFEKPTLTGISVSPDVKMDNFFFELFWSDGTKTVCRSTSTDKIRNAWINTKAEPKITVTYQIRKTENFTKTKP